MRRKVLVGSIISVLLLVLSVFLLMLFVEDIGAGDDYLVYLPTIHKASTVEFSYILSDFEFVSNLDSYRGLLSVTSDTGVKFEYRVFDYYGQPLGDGIIPPSGARISWPHKTDYIGVYVTDASGKTSVQVMQGSFARWFMTRDYPASIDDPSMCILPIFGHTSISGGDLYGVITCHIPNGMDELYLNDVPVPAIVYSEWRVAYTIPATFTIRAINDCGEAQKVLYVGGDTETPGTPQPTPTLVIP